MPQADVIFHNGKVITVDHNDTLAEAVAVTGNKISAVGPSASVMQARGDSTQVIDLRGRALLPGFNDAHTHLELTSLGLGLAVSCHTPPHESIEDILDTLSESAKEVPKGQWIIAQGSLFQDMRLKEKRYPSRRDLDRASSSHPILFKTSYHMVVLNSKALEVCGISADTPDPQGGIIERDSGGEPTGRMKDMYHRLPVPKPDYETMKNAISCTARDCFLAHGVTSLQEMSETIAGIGAMRELIDEVDFAPGPRQPDVVDHPALHERSDEVAADAVGHLDVELPLVEPLPGVRPDHPRIAGHLDGRLAAVRQRLGRPSRAGLGLGFGFGLGFGLALGFSFEAGFDVGGIVGLFRPVVFDRFDRLIFRCHGRPSVGARRRLRPGRALLRIILADECLHLRAAHPSRCATNGAAHAAGEQKREDSSHTSVLRKGGAKIQAASTR